jgi:pimeloyl-ACP methyl ester carboxylesterase
MRTVNKFWAVVVFAALIFSPLIWASASPALDQRGKENGMEFQKGYAPVDGLNLYYEIYGSAHADRLPLTLIHGGGDTIQTSFGKLIPELARDRQVIAFEQQGFGHTADISDRPFSFERSADNTAALLEYLHVERADIFGFSNGGTIALQVAIRHPRLVHKLIIASGFFNHDGADPAFWAGFEHAQPGQMPKELSDAYFAAAPHPENFQLFFDKCIQRMRNFKDISSDTMRAIASPALVIAGDADVMRPEQAVEEYRLIPHSRLAILPGTAHMEVTSRAAWLVPMINEFLDHSV